MLLNGQESEPDFARAWRLQEGRTKGKSIPWKCANPRYLAYRDWCLWGRQLERVYDRAGTARVHVVLLEDLKANPESEYRALLAKLDLAPDGRANFKVENSRRSYRNPSLVNAIDLVTRAASMVGGHIPFKTNLRPVKRALLHLKSRQIVQGAWRREISSEMKTELKASFREDMLHLSSLLKRDLSAWLE